jgi:hypothetical protein
MIEEILVKRDAGAHVPTQFEMSVAPSVLASV